MKPLVVANWKMNPVTLAEAKKLFNLVRKGTRNLKKVEVVACPPFVYLSDLKANGAQGCFWEEKGAYTGEVSPKMLKDLGAKYVILGHSERRKYLGETDEIVNKKVKAVLAEGMKPILCIDNIYQIKKGLKGVPIEKIILAFEPLSAIGTGKPYSIAKAKGIRRLIRKKFRRVPVLYGGSVSLQVARNYIKEAGFDGLLVGGASLNPGEFVKITKSIDLINKT
ncbi:MAG: triose-phosphate isomerase [bacterium]|nr:triose-phosphate isomerase [bacterium]